MPFILELLMSECLVIIPTFNEIGNIDEVISRVFKSTSKVDILVVDDNSPDGTSDKVIELKEKYPNRLFLLLNKEKKGLGKAYTDGFKWGLKRPYQYFIEMDADLSHNPDDVPRLLEPAIKQYDFVIGSRFSTGVNVVNWPLERVLMSYFASRYVKWVTGMKIHDATAGFVCYRRAVLESINFSKIKFVGYAFQIELKYKAFVRGFRWKEVPIIFTDRVNGNSKMSGHIIREAIFGVLAMKIAKLFKRF